MSEAVYAAFRKSYAIGDISVGTPCDLNCFYCSQLHNPPDLIPSYNKFLTLDEVKHFLSFAPQSGLAISGASHYINTGEFFAHPHAHDILGIVTDGGRRLSAVGTNGVRLDKGHVRMMQAHVDRVALHLCDYDRTRRALDLLDEYELPYEVLIVPYRSALESDEIANWIERLQHHRQTCIRILKPGFTKYSPPTVVREMDIRNQELLCCIDRWRRSYPSTPIEYQIQDYDLRAAIILSALQRFLVEYEQYAPVGQSSPLFLVSRAVEDVFAPVLASLTPIRRYRVKPVENRTFGGSCDVAGLLLVGDFIVAVEQVLMSGFRPDVLVLPAASFPISDVDLAGESPIAIGERFGLPVVWC